MPDFLEETKPAPPPAPPRRKEREERPKNNIKEDLDYRINGLEEAKQIPGMSPHDIAALNRSIAKLKEKKAEKAPKQENQSVEQI